MDEAVVSQEGRVSGSQRRDQDVGDSEAEEGLSHVQNLADRKKQQQSLARRHFALAGEAKRTPQRWSLLLTYVLFLLLLFLLFRYCALASMELYGKVYSFKK